MNKNKSTSLPLVVFAYAVIYIVWGSTFFFIEKALHAFPPFIIGSIRFMMAGSILMMYCKLKGYKIFEKQQVKEAAFVGFLLLFMDMAAIIWSEQFISSGIVSIISAATVIWFVILDKPQWKQNFSSPTTVLGLILGFSGVFMLFAEQVFQGDTDPEQQSLIILAMCVMTLGTIAWTLGSLYTKYTKNRRNLASETDAGNTASTGKNDHLHVMTKTAWQMLTAGLAFTIVGATNGDFEKFEPSAVSIEYWGAIVYLIVMGSILAFSCYIWLLEVRPSTEVSTYAYINPIVALLLVHFFTDHVVSKSQIIGLVVVLFSVLLMNWKLYSQSTIVRNMKRRRKIRKRRLVAPTSSIPRIMDVVEYSKQEKLKKTI